MNQPTLTVYENNSFPKKLQKEIEKILRTEWPIKEDDADKKPDWEITHHIVLSDEEKFLSYGSIVVKTLTHLGNTYKIIGMSGVITRPEERRRGYGREIITKATEIIKESNTDLALFNTAQEGLYEKFGYKLLPEAKILKGSKDHPTHYPEDVFAMFLSQKAKDHRKDFESTPIYFGKIVW